MICPANWKFPQQEDCATIYRFYATLDNVDLISE
jgi:hypothetical protein